jgi:hypothetical protein
VISMIPLVCVRYIRKHRKEGFCLCTDTNNLLFGSSLYRNRTGCLYVLQKARLVFYCYLRRKITSASYKFFPFVNARKFIKFIHETYLQSEK